VLPEEWAKSLVGTTCACCSWDDASWHKASVVEVNMRAACGVRRVEGSVNPPKGPQARPPGRRS
jgi:hypothetical protein